MNKNDVPSRRSRWLSLAKKLTQLTVKRDSLVRLDCPGFLDPDDQAGNRETVTKTTRAIARTLTAMTKVERDDPALGAHAVLAAPVPAPIHHALVLLTVARLSDAFDAELRAVADVMDYVAVETPDTALEVRLAFRADGALGKLVNMRVRDPSLDLQRPMLREDTFNAMLALPVDQEFAVTRRRVR